MKLQVTYRSITSGTYFPQYIQKFVYKVKINLYSFVKYYDSSGLVPEHYANPSYDRPICSIDILKDNLQRNAQSITYQQSDLLHDTCPGLDPY